MTRKEPAFQKISERVQRFEEQYEFYKNSDYNITIRQIDSAIRLGFQDEDDFAWHHTLQISA